MQLEFWQLAIIFVLIGFLALCFGLVAKRNGRNPWLWGVLSPVNLLLLGNWALFGHLPGRRA